MNDCDHSDATEDLRRDHIRVGRLSADFGAEIAGCDLAQPLTPAEREFIYDALLEHQLLVFHNQKLDAAHQLAFAECFGTVRDESGRPDVPDRELKPGLFTNLDAEGRPTGRHPEAFSTIWHTDGSLEEHPAKATVLFAVKVPRRGGETEFASMYAACEALGDEVRRELEKLSAIYDLQLPRSSGHPHALIWRPHEILAQPPSMARRWVRSIRLFFVRIRRLREPDVTHPIIRLHPETKRKALFLGIHAWRVKGWPLVEGIGLISDLRTWACAIQAAYVHKWQPGDLLMWDNRCMQHRGTGYDTAREARMMRRCIILDDASVDFNESDD